ncbi:MAG: MATE family efflux transporter [Treponema sp.]
MKDLTEGSEAKVLILFSLPMLLGNLLQQLYNVVDTIVVGKYVSEKALSAVGQAFPIVVVFLSLIMGFSLASNILIAQFLGAKKFDNVKKTVHTTIKTILWFGILMSIIGFLLTPYILHIMRVPKDVLEIAERYVRITFIGVIFLFIYNGFTAMLRGLGDSKSPLYFLAISTILNVILDLIFVIVFKMGVDGAAYATVIAQAVSALLLMLIACKEHEILRFNIFNLQFDKEIFIKSLKLGLPSGIQQSLVGAGFMTLTSLVNDFGSVASASFVAASKLDAFATMPSFNISLALASFVGQNMGAGKMDRVKKGFHSALAIGVAITAIFTILVMIFAKYVMMLFLSSDLYIAGGMLYIYLVVPSYIIQATMFIINGVIRGAGDTFFSMIATLLTMWVFRIPIAIFLSMFLGVKGVYLSIGIGFSIGATISFLYYISNNWAKKVKKLLDT